MKKVSIIKGPRKHDTVFKALDLIDFKTIVKGWDRSLIKVNFITTKTWETGATTDPLVVEALIKKMQEFSIDVMVIESDATVTNATKAFEITGMAEMCERNGIEWLNLRYEKDLVELPVPEPKTIKKIKVPRLVAESKIVSAAKMKTHSDTGVTLGMKNMFGLLPDKFKGRYHMRGMHNVISDINAALKPSLTVIDGFVAMEGRGPVQGTPLKMETIIAGVDVVATDATACRVMGFDPHKIGHIRMAHERGLGEIDLIEVVGADIEEIKRKFARP
jgi:uncharacterized protein (DUF362 family)